jgi:ribosomal protein S18 acetylase RimI-like enzyme
MKMIRKAENRDIGRLIELLYQADEVHNGIRPDLFKGNVSKYDQDELAHILDDDSKPIFVYEEEEVLAHAFCQISETKDHRLLQDVKTLYIDDICVDKTARGRHIGSALYEYVRDYARSIGCHNITLNVWEGNDAALLFYKSMGMKVQKIGMETIL